jgi:uncharacterized membrane protein YbhN (UPF0104 family)
VPPEILWPIAVIATVGLVGSFVLLQGGLLRWLSPFLERLLPAKLAAAVSPAGDGPVGKVNRAVTNCGWRAVVGALGASAVFNAILISWWILSGKALGLTVSPLAYITFIPILSLALMVPSIGGLGVREGVAPLLFAGVGVSEAQAVALSLVVWLLNRGTGVVGGIVYLVISLRDLRRGGRDD